MIEQSDATQLPGHTHVARKAYLSAIQGAAAQHLGVPRSTVSASLDESETPMSVHVAAPIPNALLTTCPTGSLIGALGRVRRDLRSFLTHLLGAEVGTIDMSVTSIYYPSERSENINTQTQVRRRRVE